MNDLKKFLKNLNLWSWANRIFLIVALLWPFSGISKYNMENLPSKILKVRLPFRLPLDPLELQTMADYDLLLAVTQTWFTYDSSRKAQAGLIKKWSFNSKKGEYLFEVDQSKKWSNGDPLISEHLIINLKRAVDLKSPYGLGIAAIMDMNSIKVESHSKFRMNALSKLPSETFFQRMGAHPLAIIHPSDLDDKNKVIANKFSLGPYILNVVKNDELRLIKYSLGHSNATTDFSPNEIIVKKPLNDFDLQEFLNEKTWENITQINTFIPIPMVKLLREKKLPYWTRGHDRVSLIVPTQGNNSEMKRIFIKQLFVELQAEKNLDLPLNVVKANSLQPLGYPLFVELKPNESLNESFDGKSLRAVTTNTYSSKAQISTLEPIFKSMGIKIHWDIKSKAEFFNLRSNPTLNKYDLMLFDFGVADPEASTWMGLIIKMGFLETQDSDLKKYEEITKIANKQKETLAFKQLLTEIFDRGSFVPLFHFSTLSIGHSNINLDKIKELDETVDYSQVTIK